jgi:hypothetical protein
MKIKLTKINDKNTKVPVNSDLHRIEQIKSEISLCKAQTATCEVEVLDMWADVPEC